jgi:hypothetical protein
MSFIIIAATLEGGETFGNSKEEGAGQEGCEEESSGQKGAGQEGCEEESSGQKGAGQEGCEEESSRQKEEVILLSA